VKRIVLVCAILVLSAFNVEFGMAHEDNRAKQANIPSLTDRGLGAETFVLAQASSIQAQTSTVNEPRKPIRIKYRGLDKSKRYWAILLDPTRQAGKNGDYIQYLEIAPRASAELAFRGLPVGEYVVRIQHAFRGAPTLLETQITVGAMPAANNFIDSASGVTYRGSGDGEDVILGTYSGIYNCGRIGSPFRGSKVEVVLHTIEGSGKYARHDAKGQMTFTDPETSEELFSGEIWSNGIQLQSRSVGLGWQRKPVNIEELVRSDPAFGDINFGFQSVFDRSFNTIAITPQRGSLATGLAKCSTSTLKRTAGPSSSAPTNLHATAPEVTLACVDTTGPKGVANCLEAAADARKTHGIRVMDEAFSLIIPSAYQGSPRPCSVIQKRFDIFLDSVTHEYGVRFAFDTSTCRRMFEVLAEMGKPYPIPEACERNMSLPSIEACLGARIKQGHRDIADRLRKSIEHCKRSGSATTALPSTLQLIAGFENGDQPNERMLRDRLDCPGLFKIAHGLEVISDQEYSAHSAQTEKDQAYACSAERAAKPPTRAEMIKALSREISNRCTPEFTLSQFAKGHGDANSVLGAGLFDYRPTGRTCELHLKLTSIAGSPSYVIRVGDFSNTTCSPAGSQAFNCSGIVFVKVTSDSTQRGIEVLEGMASSRGPISANFRFDSKACEWKVTQVTPE
jgi:hypothetical protein